MSTSIVTFSGMSAFASDFQTVIQRAVQIASMPITQLDTTKTNLEDQLSEYTTLDTDMSTWRTAVAQLQTALTGSDSYDVSTTTTVLTASASSGAMAGSCDVNVTQFGSCAKYMVRQKNSWTESGSGNLPSE